MKFPKDVILESVAERSDHKQYGIKFIQELGNDDAGGSEMLVEIFQYKNKFYSVDIQRIHGKNNYETWADEIECPEVIRREVIHYYWEEVKK
jgi:hypothetical protein